MNSKESSFSIDRMIRDKDDNIISIILIDDDENEIILPKFLFPGRLGEGMYFNITISEDKKKTEESFAEITRLFNARR